MEISDSTSTIRTPAFHGLEARIADMEITCWSSAVRTLLPHGPDARSLIWKLLAADVRLFGRKCLTVRMQLSNRKDFQWNFWKILSHSCPSGRRPYKTLQSPILYLNLQIEAPGHWELQEFGSEFHKSSEKSKIPLKPFQVCCCRAINWSLS
jgi:hypothetical protein